MTVLRRAAVFTRSRLRAAARAVNDGDNFFGIVAAVRSASGRSATHDGEQLVASTTVRAAPSEVREHPGGLTPSGSWNALRG